MVGVCKVLQGKIGTEYVYLKKRLCSEKRRVIRAAADWYRLFLAEVYLQIIAGNEKPPFTILLKNLPILVKVMVTASSRIPALIGARILEESAIRPEWSFSSAKRK